MKSGDEQIHTFMFSSLLVAVTCVLFKIVFGHIYAPNQFEFFVELLSKIQYAHYKTLWKTYLFLQFQLSTLTIHKDPIFDVTKITRFWRSMHNANSPLFLSFPFTLSQTDYVHKIFHFNSSCVSRDISRTVEVGIWFLANINGYLERSSASVTSCLSHCSLSFLINYLVFWRFACCKPCLCDFNLSES